MAVSLLGRVPNENPLDDTVGGSVTKKEKQDMIAAFTTAKFPSFSAGVRSILVAYVRDAQVRDAVDSHILKEAA